MKHVTLPLGSIKRSLYILKFFHAGSGETVLIVAAGEGKYVCSM